MASAIKNPPPPGAHGKDYNYVLRKRRELPHDPSIENYLPGYEESVKTRDITHNDGLRSQTAFIRTGHFAQRLRCQGWEDVTDMWLKGRWPNGNLPSDEENGDDQVLARAAKAAAEDGGIESVEV